MSGAGHVRQTPTLQKSRMPPCPAPHPPKFLSSPRLNRRSILAQGASTISAFKQTI